MTDTTKTEQNRVAAGGRLERLVMRSCPGCGEELLEDEEYFGVCTDCKDGASDLEELMGVAMRNEPDDGRDEMPDGTTICRQGW